MNFITFQPMRTIGIPNVKYIKPDHMYREKEAIQQADVVLFPHRWQVNGLVYGWKKPIFPSVETIHLGIDKIEMTRALWTVCPEYVPYTEIVRNNQENREEIMDTFSFPFVVKAPKSSMGNGVFLIKDEQDFAVYTEQHDVLYVQEYLQSDRELRINVVGEEIIASYWKISQEGEFYHNIAKGGTISTQHIPKDALELVLQVASRLNINHAGFDVLMIDGKPYILEFNVLFGNQGLMEQGISVSQKIYEYLLHHFRPISPNTPSPDKSIS